MQQERRWNAKQKSKLKARFELKMAKKRSATDHSKKLLADCKTWSGPSTTAEELLEILSKIQGQTEFIVKTKMAYYANTHKTDKMQYLKLY